MQLFPKFIHFLDECCRAKEAAAGKAKAEQELVAVTLQLETAMARAHECEEKERLAEEMSAQHKVSRFLTVFACFVTLPRTA